MDQNFLWAIVSSLVAFLLAVVSADNQGRRKAFASYRILIQQVREKLTQGHDHELRALHASTIEEVRRESIKVSESVYPWKRTRFDDAWHQYCDSDAKDFEKDSKFIQVVLKGSGHEYTLIRDKLTQELDQLLAGLKVL